MVVVLVVAGLAAAAAWQAVTASTALQEAVRRDAAIASEVARAELALADVAAAQRGYVAPGQGLAFWTLTTDDGLNAVRGAIAALEADTGTRLDTVRARLDALADIDARARRFAANDQRGMASDLIFADADAAVAAARAELTSSVSALGATSSAVTLRNEQLFYGSLGVLGFIAIVGMLTHLKQGPREAEPLVTSLGDELSMSSRRVSVDDEAIGAALDASLADFDDSLSSTPLDEPVAAPTEEPAAVVTSSAAEHAAPPAQVETPALVALPGIADVCVDLARLLDGRDLAPLLARAASALSARGLIVWMPAGQDDSLAPALTHGYAPALVARLGQLERNADNVTAAAWRDGESKVTGGALAVPLLTVDGCSGVLAVEIDEGRERDAHVQALARIVAAQLSTTVMPATAENRKAASS